MGKKRRARPSIDITDSIHALHGIEYEDESKSDNEESDISDLSDDLSKTNDIIIEKTTKGQEEWEDLELFNYEDVSADSNKADEAVALMGNLLKDMDKALEAMSRL